MVFKINITGEDGYKIFNFSIETEEFEFKTEDFEFTENFNPNSFLDVYKSKIHTKFCFILSSSIIEYKNEHLIFHGENFLKLKITEEILNEFENSKKFYSIPNETFNEQLVKDFYEDLYYSDLMERDLED